VSCLSLPSKDFGRAPCQGHSTQRLKTLDVKCSGTTLANSCVEEQVCKCAFIFFCSLKLRSQFHTLRKCLERHWPRADFFKNSLNHFQDSFLGIHSLKNHRRSQRKKQSADELFPSRPNGCVSTQRPPSRAAVRETFE
jgi:hypothetical protein